MCMQLRKFHKSLSSRSKIHNLVMQCLPTNPSIHFLNLLYPVLGHGVAVLANAGTLWTGHQSVAGRLVQEPFRCTLHQPVCDVLLGSKTEFVFFQFEFWKEYHPATKSQCQHYSHDVSVSSLSESSVSAFTAQASPTFLFQPLYIQNIFLKGILFPL